MALPHNSNQIFASREMNPKYDPKFIDKREARDSEEHPNSTPIIIGVDVTGSMGYLSTQIIKESLNELMQKLYSTNMVQDPQLLFAAIGDATDRAPLQVTQFESDIRIAEQLMELWIENNGGDAPEDYELLWYFAAKHTETDCCTKRGEKGFCFTIGDAGFHEELYEEDIEGIFGDKMGKGRIRSTKLAEMASEKYELFHIIIGDKDNNALNIIPGRVLRVYKTDINYLPEIIISAMQLSKGMSEEKILEQWGELARPVVKKAISSLRIQKKLKISF
ncbi:MAG: hypothetical protein MJ124_10245 [Lachnospiraceae bacterium]|nr:hypothetical protein [Lachnospiraceae bacterium]